MRFAVRIFTHGVRAVSYTHLNKGTQTLCCYILLRVRYNKPMPVMSLLANTQLL